MGNLYVGWLADAARLTGYPVVEVAGWRTRGHGGMRVVEGMVLHHTADGPGEYPSLRVVRDGRSDLPGPLCNYGLARSGAIYVVAAGCAWHAGASKWAGFSDLNDEFLGVEAESAGSRDDWTAAQRDAYHRLAAAAMHYIRRGSDRVGGHKEVCLPKGRKIDPAFWDLNGFRSTVGWMLADPLRRIPRNASGAAAPSAPAAPPKPKGIPKMIERRLTVGNNHGRVNCPAQNRSKIASEVWVSVSCEGGGKGTVAFQADSNTDGPPAGAGSPWQVTVRNGNRGRIQLPPNTDFLEFWLTVNGVRQQDGSVSGEGSLLVEFVPK